MTQLASLHSSRWLDNGLLLNQSSVGEQVWAVAQSLLPQVSVENTTAAQQVQFRYFCGVLCAILNSLLSSMGLTMQRAARLRQQEALFRWPYLRLCGLAIYILAALPDVVSYALMPEVVCGTFAGFRLVVVFAMAHVFLGERIRRREVYGISVCIVGTILCAVCGPRPEQRAAAELSGSGIKVFIYLSSGLLVLLALLVLEHLQRFQERMRQSLLRFILCSAASLAFGLEKVVNTLLGSFTFSFDMLLHPPEHAASISMASAVVAFGILDLYLTDRGTGKMTVKVFAPVVFAYGQCLQVFQSIFIFEDFKGTAGENVFFALLGAVLSLLGALAIDPPQCRILKYPPALVEMHGPPLAPPVQGDVEAQASSEGLGSVMQAKAKEGYPIHT
mmetsp:Transcript_56310/g.131964  ORF Transcript_56310/g.131964 Transcript_56310/m.131964 type:complete len:389 (+) Transcript_56310:47-1213(+)